MKTGDLVRVNNRCSAHSSGRWEAARHPFFFVEKGTLAILIGLDPRYDHWRNNNRYEILLNDEIATVEISFLELVTSETSARETA